MAKTVLDQNTLDSIRDLQSEDEPEFFKTFLVDFLSSVANSLKEIEQAIHDQKPAELSRVAHVLKSACGNTGATELVVLSTELESLGQSGSIAGTAPIFEKLKSEFDLVKTQIQSLPEFKKGAS